MAGLRRTSLQSSTSFQFFTDWGWMPASRWATKKLLISLSIVEAGDAVTIDVKPIAGQHDWPINNVDTAPKKGHFIVLVSYEGKINDPEFWPAIWVILRCEICQFVKPYNNGKMRVVSRALVKNGRQVYKGAWRLLTVAP